MGAPVGDDGKRGEGSGLVEVTRYKKIIDTTTRKGVFSWCMGNLFLRLHFIGFVRAVVKSRGGDLDFRAGGGPIKLT